MLVRFFYSFWLLLSVPLFLSAQENLIPNPSFEEYYKLPDKDGCFNDYISYWSNLNGNKGYPNATPDYLHKKGSDNGKVEKYYYSKVEPQDGDAMMGVIIMTNHTPPFYEYVCAPLRKQLRVGKRYEVSFWVNNGEPQYCACSARGFGLHFSTQQPKQQKAERVNITPQIMIEDNFYTKTWQKVHFRFTADADYTHMTLGYFPSPEDMQVKDVKGGGSKCVYFFVDNFNLVEIPDDSSKDLIALNLPEGISNINSKLGTTKLALGTKDIPPIPTPAKITLTTTIQIKDKKTNLPISAKISVVDLALQTEIKQIDVTASQKIFNFEVPDASKRYGIFAKAQGYMEGSENIEPQTLKESKTIEKTIFLSPLQKGESIILKNIYFETAKADLKQEAFVELNKLLNLLKENPKLKIEIQGHTDSEGEDYKNIDLSNRRAKSVVEYLIKNGILPTRLQSKGYGETKPIESNETAEGRQQNRRVELKILEN